LFNNPLKYPDPTGYNAYDGEGEYIHTMCFGENSRIDEMWRERFGEQFYDVFYGKEEKVRTIKQEVQPIILEDMNGKLVTFLIPIQKPNTSDVKIIVHTYKAFPSGYNQNGVYFQLGVKGKYYSEYNWVQTCSVNGAPSFCDPPLSVNNGFFENSSYSDYWKIAYPNYNGFFNDIPQSFNGESQAFELTLVGKRGDKWEAITSLSWGYRAESGGITILMPLTPLPYPSQTHLYYLNYVLNYYNQ
jgi:hypothetical protein